MVGFGGVVRAVVTRSANCCFYRSFSAHRRMAAFGEHGAAWLSAEYHDSRVRRESGQYSLCAADGMDEISISAPTTVAEVKDGVVRHFQIKPDDFNIRQEENNKALLATSPSESLSMINQIFLGEKGPAHNVVSLNAGAALYVGGLVSDLGSGVQMASNALIDGKAAKKFSEFINYTNTFKQ